MSSLSLKDKVIFITGTSRGLGRTIASGLHSEGAIVIGTSTSDEGVRSLESIGIQARKVDVTEMGVFDPIFQDLKAKYGRIDCILNNAGLATNTPASGFKEEELRKILDTNLTGVFRSCQAYYKLQKKEGGNIINISSVLGVVGSPLASIYSAAKGGVISLTKALAIEWAGNSFRVNCVSPGFFDTDMTSMIKKKPDVMEKFVATIPMKRMGEPKELVGICQFLASDASSYVTGQNFLVDGGFSAS